jgi:glycosyltransferase involved in cell wall biosynthesis
MAEAQITTIIPTFRRPVLLRRAIESVLAQSYSDFKLCVYDNASGDETEAVVAAYAQRDARVVYFKNGQNIGAVNNMIRGVEGVTTPFYSLLNDDDFLLPGFFENVMAGFARHPSAGFACAKSLIVDRVRNRISFRNRDWEGGFYEPSIENTNHMFRSHFTQTGVVLRQSMRQDIGLFEKSGNDILYLAMAATRTPFVVLDSFGAVFVSHAQSYSATVGTVNIDMAKLYEAMLYTVDNVMKMAVEDERKVHLLSLVMNAYFEIFEARKLDALKAGQGGAVGSPVLDLPSRMTSSGVANSVYARAPDRLHGVVTTGLKAMDAVDRLNRARKQRRRPGRNVVAVPNGVAAFFDTCDSDVSKFVASLKLVADPGLAEKIGRVERV